MKGPDRTGMRSDPSLSNIQKQRSLKYAGFVIVGLGMDLVEVARIERAMKNPRFVEKVLTERERETCKTSTRVAGRWAAKEAVMKATGIPLTFRQVEIVLDEIGAPRAIVHSGHFDPRRLRLHVTITHERQHAAAVAVLERVIMQASFV